MAQSSWEVRRYINEKGIRPFEEWRSTLGLKEQFRVDSRLKRISVGNFGDHKPVGEGVYELRLFFGSGYRIYYATTGTRVILLLAGGDKKSQSKDIRKAQDFWNRYKSERRGDL